MNQEQKFKEVQIQSSKYTALTENQKYVQKEKSLLNKKYDLKKQKYQKIVDEIQEIQLKINITSKYKCQVCENKEFRKLKDLQNHIDTQHKKINLTKHEVQKQVVQYLNQQSIQVNSGELDEYSQKDKERKAKKQEQLKKELVEFDQEIKQNLQKEFSEFEKSMGMTIEKKFEQIQEIEGKKQESTLINVTYNNSSLNEISIIAKQFQDLVQIQKDIFSKQKSSNKMIKYFQKKKGIKVESEENNEENLAVSLFAETGKIETNQTKDDHNKQQQIKNDQTIKQQEKQFDNKEENAKKPEPKQQQVYQLTPEEQFYLKEDEEKTNKQEQVQGVKFLQQYQQEIDEEDNIVNIGDSSESEKHSDIEQQKQNNDFKDNIQEEILNQQQASEFLKSKEREISNTEFSIDIKQFPPKKQEQQNANDKISIRYQDQNQYYNQQAVKTSLERVQLLDEEENENQKSPKNLGILPVFSQVTPSNEITQELKTNNALEILQIIQSCGQTNQKYKSSQFPPIEQNICKNYAHPSYQSVFGWMRFQRPDVFYDLEEKKEMLLIVPKQSQLMSNLSKLSIQVEQPDKSCRISQNECAFIATVGVFQTRFQLLEEIFSKQTQVNPQGVYEVTVYKQGIPVQLIVDDCIPCTVVEQTKNLAKRDMFFPICCQTYLKLNEWQIVPLLGPMLVHRALAELVGQYAFENIGLPMYSLPYFQKAPVKTYDLSENIFRENNKEFLRKFIGYNVKNNFLIIVNSQFVAQNNIYSFVLLEYCNSEVPILKLQNPYKKFQIKNQILDSEEIKSLNPNDKYQNNVQHFYNNFNNNASLIYITMDQLIQDFQSITICYQKDHFSYSYIVGEALGRKSIFFKFSLKNSQQLYLRLHFLSEEIKRDLNLRYKYSSVDFQLYKLTKDNQSIDSEITLGSKEKFFGNSQIHINDGDGVNLTQGDYLIRVKVFTPAADKMDIVISCYSYGKIVLSSLERAIGKKIINSYYLQYCKKHQISMKSLGQNVKFA